VDGAARDVLVELPPGRGKVTGDELGAADDDRGVLLGFALGADVVGRGDGEVVDRSLDDGVPPEDGTRDRGAVELGVGVGAECTACDASRFAEIGRIRK
jgi:hypothetical protein